MAILKSLAEVKLAKNYCVMRTPTPVHHQVGDGKEGIAHIRLVVGTEPVVHGKFYIIPSRNSDGNESSIKTSNAPWHASSGGKALHNSNFLC